MTTIAVPENDLMTGVATLLNAAGVGVYGGAGVVPQPSEVGIFLGQFPDSPGSLIAMTTFVLSDDPVNPVSKIALHLQMRAPTISEVNTIGQGVFAALHGFTGPLGSVNVIQALRRQSVPMGFDDSKRWSRVDHFYVDVDTAPTTYRPLGGWN